MKISKLFHWLYAFVMFLPVFAIGSTLLISTFNMGTKQESEIHYKYQTNEVNNINDLVEGNIYHIEIDNKSIAECFNYSGNAYFYFEFVNVNSYDFRNYNFTFDSVFKNSYEDNGYLCFKISCDTNDITTFGFLLTQNGNNDEFISISSESLDYDLFSINGDFLYYPFSNVTGFNINCITQSTYNVIESVETHNLDTQEVFYNAVDKVTESPLFSWAYNSFLVAPFSYIVVLFGMPTNHVVVELLSYWLSISIIWLVFDLVMYVPLLVHRWLDKGVLE